MTLNAGKAYQKAVNSLKPNLQKMKRINAEINTRANKARDEVKAMLDAGKDAMELYQNETDKERRIILIGYLRRGEDALIHT